MPYKITFWNNWFGEPRELKSKFFRGSKEECIKYAESFKRKDFESYTISEIR